MKKKVKIVIIAIIAVMLLGGYFVYDYIKHKDDCCSPCSTNEICPAVCARCD